MHQATIRQADLPLGHIVFTLLLVASSLSAAQTGMAGLHAYTAALPTCIDSPRVRTRDAGGLDGAQLLCALEHVMITDFVFALALWWPDLFRKRCQLRT